MRINSSFTLKKTGDFPEDGEINAWTGKPFETKMLSYFPSSFMRLGNHPFERGDSVLMAPNIAMDNFAMFYITLY
jgi:hypothetical protein